MKPIKAIMSYVTRIIIGIRKAEQEIFIKKRADKLSAKMIKQAVDEKNKAIEDAHDFYLLYRDVPKELDEIWTLIAHYDRIMAENAAKRTKISGTIEDRIKRAVRIMNKMDTEANELLGLNKEGA